MLCNYIKGGFWVIAYCRGFGSLSYFFCFLSLEGSGGVEGGWLYNVEYEKPPFKKKKKKKNII